MRKPALVAALAGVIALAACAVIALQSLSPYISFTLQIVDSSGDAVPNAAICSAPWNDPTKEMMQEETTDSNGCVHIPEATLGKHRVDIYDAETSGWCGWREIIVTREMSGSTFVLSCTDLSQAKSTG